MASIQSVHTWPRLVMIIWLCIAFAMTPTNSGATSQETGPDSSAVVERAAQPSDRDELTKLQHEIAQLRQEQELTTRIAILTNERIQRTLDLLTFFFLGITAFVALFTAWATYKQSRRDEKRERLFMRLQRKIGQTDITGAKRVAEILEVIHLTLKSRFMVWTKQRRMIARLRGQLKTLEAFIQTAESAKDEWRNHLEAQAKRLAQTPRHELRRSSRGLEDFEREFEMFHRQYPFEKEFSGRCLYVRGIAALLVDQPAMLEKHLKRVIELQPESDEDQVSHAKRIANALFYLGLHHANFGEFSEAISHLERARSHDLPQSDLLTRIVMAETYAMAGQYDDANVLLNDTEQALHNLERAQGLLFKHQLRLKARTLLIRANLAFLSRPDNWQEEMRVRAQQAHDVNGRYYYATFTLAQIESTLGDTGQAQQFFQRTYTLINESGDLKTSSEKRIQVLLNMVCALCCRHGEIDRELFEDFLNAAEGLRRELPRIGSRQATVFSPLSKKNESHEVIHTHLELIRLGKVFSN